LCLLIGPKAVLQAREAEWGRQTRVSSSSTPEIVFALTLAKMLNRLRREDNYGDDFPGK
jgi:hypothetical protein